jgi:hypothetical protein
MVSADWALDAASSTIIWSMAGSLASAGEANHKAPMIAVHAESERLPTIGAYPV